MRILLVGVSCIGKSTIGKLLAEIMDYKFFDFDFEVEERMNEHISSIKKRTLAFINEKGYRDEVKHILDDILTKNEDNIVIPSFGSSVIFNTKIGIFLDFAPLFMGLNISEPEM